MYDVLLAAGWLWSSDGVIERLDAPHGWADTSDAEVQEARALEQRGWAAGESLRGTMLLVRSAEG
jgi:hypothetical protein